MQAFTRFTSDCTLGADGTRAAQCGGHESELSPESRCLISGILGDERQRLLSRATDTSPASYAKVTLH